MDSVRTLAQEIVQREGGYVDDRDDPGGATNYGVTGKTLKRLGLDINSDGHVNAADLHALSIEQAVDIFVAEYFWRPGIGKLPAALHPTVFDMQVNAGSQAIGLLQGLLEKIGLPVSIDRVIGPQTIAATYKALEMAPEHLVDAYGIERRNFYYRLARDRAASRKYVRRLNGGKGGWILRAEAFISEKYHLSVGEHAERISGWA